MPFLVDADYQAQIKSGVLLDIIQNDAPTRATAELAAEAELVSYLSARYDTVAIFSATGTDRNAVIVMLYVDMVLYHLHARISPEQVPTLRAERYRAAKDWLKAVAKQEINPALPLPTDTDGNNPKEEVRYGSNPARSHHF